MELEVLRYHTSDNHTNGLLFVDGSFECDTLEDGYNEIKVYGETRIPDGRYKIILRTVGGFHNRYLNRFGSEWHKGMLWIQDVENFEYILIHIGNTVKDTKGCLLVGDSPKRETGFIANSTKNYKRLYEKVIKAMECGEEVYITYKAIA